MGQAQGLGGDKNRVLMACSDMDESGKWTDIFISKNSPEHLLSPHSLIFFSGLFLASLSTAQAGPQNKEPCSCLPWPPTEPRRRQAMNDDCLGLEF